MATTIKDSVYKAIDVIVGKRIEDLHLDKTIEATVIKCINLSDKKYELKYGSGVFYAYARQNEIYTPNSTVYVLVPENNFNKTKWIIGKANTGSQTNINESQSIATMTSGYSIIGKNILSYKTDNTTIGLNSDIGSQYIILYDAKQNNKANLINVNNEALKIYLQESQGFIFSAQFQSNLSKRQITGKEDFGLIFNLRLKNGKTSFPTLQDRWEAQEPNTQCTIDNKEIRLNDLREKVEQLWTTTSVSEENIDYSNITVDFLQEQLSNYVIELQAFAQELTFLDDQTAELVKLYIQLIDNLSAYTLNNNNNPITVEDIINLYYEWFTNESYAFQETIYTVVLNTEKMTGNPYYLFSPTYQYTFSEIDPETFIGIESIYFYSECPSGTHNLANEMDIRITDIGINCIKYLDNINGDYRLDIKCSDIYFGQNASNETNITVTAKIFYQNNTDVTPYSRIMWFKQNNNITSSSANYSIYGGLGWQQLTTTTHNIFTTTAAQNLVYKNYYKVVAMYESGTIVQQEFIIYNEKHQHNIELSSDSGTSFGIGSGQKYITCLVDNQIDILHYQYNWYISANNNVQYKIKTQEELFELENEIKDISISLSDKAKKQQEFNVISNIIQLEDKNIIEVQSIALPLNGSINIICEVYTKDSQLLIGSANITLTNQRTINIKDYYIEIVNGNQAFQYNESGISPCSNVFEKPLIPLSLKCNFYDPMGGLINPLRYNTSWEIPIENTLIHTDTNNLTYNNVSGLNNLLTSDTCTFTISDEYNYNYTNNQIVCIVEFDDGNGLVSYRQPTNFFFGKIGDHGTNGTDIITKIHVVPNDSATIRDDYNNNTLLKEKLTLIIEQTNSDIEGEYNYNYIWNNGVITDYPILQLDLFKKNELIQPSEYRKVNSSVLTNGLSSKNWKTINNNTDNTKQVILQYDATKLSSNQNYTNYIIKAQADLPIDDNNFQTYYDFYPVCTNLKYAAAAETNYTVGIDSARTLQYVTYNSDGRNPLYNKNLGVGLSFKNLDSPRTIVWESHGGISTQDKLESYPSFTIGKQISYMPSYSTEIQEYLDELEEQKTNALLEFKDNFNIFNQLNIEKNNQLDMLNEEKQKLQDLEQTYQDNLNQDREKFNQTQKDNIDYGIQRLKERIVNIGALTTNVITLTNYTEQDDDSTNFNWFRIVSIDDAVNPVYNSDQDFIDDLYLYCTTLDDTTIQILETKFKSLVFEVYFTNDTIENPKNANIIKEYFIKFINNTVLLGYKTNKKIFDSKHQDIYDNIESTSKKKESLIEQIEIYENILINNENNQLIQYKPTEETIVDIADINILQGIIQNFDSPNNSIMQYSEIWNLIVSVQTQYYNNLNLIIQKYDTQINFLSGILTDDTDPTFCSVIPNEIYSGEYPNQYVKVKIYQGLIDKIDDTSILEHELIIPFHMSLNTYGLASLNAWDGNSVEINEDAGYVLAPQIGAGIKHPEDNTFTGILMGTEKTFDNAAGQEEVGLLGYSHGKRSIFLDAATGNATFGLPEDDSKDVSNPLTEGRIELRPGGTSSISKWNFDSRSLYRIASEDETEAIIKQRKYINQLSDTSLGEPYDDAPEYAHGSIPHTKQGILFSALPAYASFKGRVLTDEDHEKEKVEYTNANTTVRPGDTFELQIDPNDSKFFTLYEHSTRIYNGRGLYGTILDIFFATQLKWFEIDKDTQAEIGFYPRFKEYLGEGATYNEQTRVITLGENSKIKDINNTYFLVQRYVENSVYKYRVLSYLSKNEIDEWKWTIENCVLDNDCKITNEYAIATAKTYENWSIERTLQLVWTNIVFKANEDIVENGVLVEVELDNTTNNILAITLPENNTIITDATKVWHRYKKAGINALGEFSAESVGTGGLNLGLRGITAFDQNSAWIGPSFDSGSNTILKIFISEGATANKDDKAPVFISSSNVLNTFNNQDDEGQRPIRIYAGQNYQPRGAGEKEYNTGIFVGKSAAQHPVNSIAKLEFDQTSSNDNKITLSALGSDIVKNSSILTLQSSSDTNSQEGSLIHTGDWKTEIGQNLTQTIDGDINLVGKGKCDYNITNSFTAYIGSNKSKITINDTSIDLYNNEQSRLFLYGGKSMSLLYGYHGVNITGGYKNKNTDAAEYALQLNAIHTTKGIRMQASKSETNKTTACFILNPSGDGSFNLYTNKSYVNSYFKNGEAGVYLGPNVIIDDNGTGKLKSGNIISTGNITATTKNKGIIKANKFTGDGTNITHTVNILNSKGNVSHTATAGPSKDKSYKPGYGGSVTLDIPYIYTHSNGRITIENRKVTITMPTAQSLKHTHLLSGVPVYDPFPTKVIGHAWGSTGYDG